MFSKVSSYDLQVVAHCMSDCRYQQTCFYSVYMISVMASSRPNCATACDIDAGLKAAVLVLKRFTWQYEAWR